MYVIYDRILNCHSICEGYPDVRWDCEWIVPGTIDPNDD
jgi:hypothetical protein